MQFKYVLGLRILEICFCAIFLGSILFNAYKIFDSSSHGEYTSTPTFVKNFGNSMKIKTKITTNMNCDDCDSEITDLAVECDADYSDLDDQIWCMIVQVEIDCYDCLCEYLYEDFGYECIFMENRNGNRQEILYTFQNYTDFST